MRYDVSPTQDKTLGLLQQALERAPRWQIKKLTGTYLTLSLAEIGNAVRITDEETVRDTILSMVRRSTCIMEHLSADNSTPTCEIMTGGSL